MKTPFTVILRIGHSVQKRKTTQQGFRYEKNSLLNIRIQRQDYLVVSGKWIYQIRTKSILMCYII